MVALQVCTGLTCILVGMSLVMDFGSIQVVINCLGTFFAEMCFGLVYLYCAELYPTGLRATATGICSSVGRYVQLPDKPVRALLLKMFCEMVYVLTYKRKRYSERNTFKHIADLEGFLHSA